MDDASQDATAIEIIVGYRHNKNGKPYTVYAKVLKGQRLIFHDSTRIGELFAGQIYAAKFADVMNQIERYADELCEAYGIASYTLEGEFKYFDFDAWYRRKMFE